MGNTKRNIVLFKIEDTYGVDSVPTPAENAILVLDLAIGPKGTKMERTPGMKSTGQLNPINGKKWLEVSFGVEVRGSGVLGTPPRSGAIIKACGRSETIVPYTSVDYDYISDNRLSGTLYGYMDGLLWKIPGCRGSMEVVGDVDQISRMNFTLQAPYASYEDADLPDGCVYDPKPEPFLSANFSFDSLATLKISQLQFNDNYEIQQSVDANHAHGMSVVTLGNRKPSGSFNPEAVTKATKDFYGLWEDSTESALTCTFGQTAGKKMILTGPKVTLDEVNLGDRNGIRIFDIPVSFGMTTPTSNDEGKLQFV